MTVLYKTISGYISCMVMPLPGFSCPLAAAIMSPDYTYNTATGIRSYAPKHYVGVLQYLPGLHLPLGKGNMARFLWNVMAFDSSDGTLGASCDPYKKTCLVGQVSNLPVASCHVAGYLFQPMQHPQTVAQSMMFGRRRKQGWDAAQLCMMSHTICPCLSTCTHRCGWSCVGWAMLRSKPQSTHTMLSDCGIC